MGAATQDGGDCYAAYLDGDRIAISTEYLDPDTGLTGSTWTVQWIYPVLLGSFLA